MTLIDRYVLGTFGRVLMWSMLAFLSVFVLIDLVDHIDDFIDDQAHIVSILKYYLTILPQYVDFVLPISMLLASLFTISLLSKNQEYTAILAAGVSLARMSRWILLAGLLIAAGATLFREEVVAEANRRHTDVKEHEIEGRPRTDLFGRTNFVHSDAAGRVYVVSRFRTRPPTLDRLSIQTYSDSTLVERIDAERAVWEGDHWRLERGTVRRFGPDGREQVERFESRALEPPVEAPEHFSRKRPDPDEMNWKQMRDFAEWVESTGGDATPYRAIMANKLAFPLVNFLVVVLGLALGAARRKPTLWAGFGLTVGLAFGYWVLMDIGLSLGKSGLIPAWASAWSGNFLYGMAGLVLFWRANR